MATVREEEVDQNPHDGNRQPSSVSRGWGRKRKERKGNGERKREIKEERKRKRKGKKVFFFFSDFFYPTH